MKEFTISFTWERSTKNTERYQEDLTGNPPRIGTLYIQRWALGNPVPQKIKVTVSETAIVH